MYIHFNFHFKIKDCTVQSGEMVLKKEITNNMYYVNNVCYFFFILDNIQKPYLHLPNIKINKSSQQRRRSGETSEPLN